MNDLSFPNTYLDLAQTFFHTLDTLSSSFTLFIDQPSLNGHSNSICVHALKPAQSGNLMPCVVAPAGAMEKGRAESFSAFPASTGNNLARTP